MPLRMPQRAALLPAMILSTMAVVTVAHAQITPGPGGMMDPGSMLRQGASMAPKTGPTETAAPPALPGAVSHGNTAPATQIATDMSPNAALFDAINRGDIAAARDALSRGAELNARNMLGMTPMELSVDLGRNDISFLLLSYRGSESPQAPARQAAAAAPGTAPAKVAKPTLRPQKNVVPVKDVVPAPPQRPRLFANDGGAPVPSAGFLGFDSGHPAR